MDVVGRINILIWAWVQSLRSAKRISIFLPFFLFIILQAFVLTALILFFLPPLSHFLVPLTMRLYGEMALHYPHYYIYLPDFFDGASRWLNLLVSWLIIGTATLMFAAQYRGQEPRFAKSFARAMRCIVPLFTVGAVEWGVLWLVRLLLRQAVPVALLGGGQSYRFFLLTGFLLHLALITPFAFTTAHVVLGEKGIGGALRGSFSLARGNFGVTYFIFAVPSVLTLVMNWVLRKTPLVVSKFSPELVIFLMAFSLVVTLVVSFVIVGALTALYMHATEKAR
jgi:hypothetical protein